MQGRRRCPRCCSSASLWAASLRVDPMFTHLNFENAFMVRSNLGGQGGKCTTVGVCDELQSAATPHEVYIRNVATGPNGERIDLRITNATE